MGDHVEIGRNTYGVSAVACPASRVSRPGVEILSTHIVLPQLVSAPPFTRCSWAQSCGSHISLADPCRHIAAAPVVGRFGWRTCCAICCTVAALSCAPMRAPGPRCAFDAHPRSIPTRVSFAAPPPLPLRAEPRSLPQRLPSPSVSQLQLCPSLCLAAIATTSRRFRDG